MSYFRFSGLASRNLIVLLQVNAIASRRGPGGQHPLDRDRGSADDADDVRRPLHLGHVQRVLVAIHRARVVQARRVRESPYVNWTFILSP